MKRKNEDSFYCISYYTLLLSLYCPTDFLFTCRKHGIMMFCGVKKIRLIENIGLFPNLKLVCGTTDRPHFSSVYRQTPRLTKNTHFRNYT